jgi:hypothetical protein
MTFRHADPRGVLGLLFTRFARACLAADRGVCAGLTSQARDDRGSNFFRLSVFYRTDGALLLPGVKRRQRRSVLREEVFQMISTVWKQWLVAPLAALLLLGAASGAQAKGCIKGAAVGAVAGHFARHHAVIGAAAGCVVGHHMAKKRQREEAKERREEQRRQAQSKGG